MDVVRSSATNRFPTGRLLRMSERSTPVFGSFPQSPLCRTLVPGNNTNVFTYFQLRPAPSGLALSEHGPASAGWSNQTKEKKKEKKKKEMFHRYPVLPNWSKQFQCQFQFQYKFRSILPFYYSSITIRILTNYKRCCLSSMTDDSIKLHVLITLSLN